MLEAFHPTSVACLNQAGQADIAPTGANTATKAELLSRAKAAIEIGERSLHEAAEALGVAQELHSATQREMAEAIGKSAAWINKLLKWRRSGYKDHSPFGPTTKRERVEHAQHQAKASKPRSAATETGDAYDPETSAAKRKAGYAKQEPMRNLRSPAKEWFPKSRPPPRRRGGLICALDQWWPHLDDAGRREVIDHFLDKADRWDGDAAGETRSAQTRRLFMTMADARAAPQERPSSPPEVRGDTART